jgi:hypothetical protein
MGKRQIRILGKDCMAKMQEIMHIPLTLILRNGATYAGLIARTEGENIRFKDHLQSMHTFPAIDIVEIIVDKEAAF